jgi:hypothetical protein
MKRRRARRRLARAPRARAVAGGQKQRRVAAVVRLVERRALRSAGSVASAEARRTPRALALARRRARARLRDVLLHPVVHAIHAVAPDVALLGHKAPGLPVCTNRKASVRAAPRGRSGVQARRTVRSNGMAAAAASAVRARCNAQPLRPFRAREPSLRDAVHVYRRGNRRVLLAARYTCALSPPLRRSLAVPAAASHVAAAAAAPWRPTAWPAAPCRRLRRLPRRTAPDGPRVARARWRLPAAAVLRHWR